MSNHNEIRTIERVLCFSLEIHIWSGRRKLRTTDIGEIDELPNSDLASLGSKKVIDSEHLKPFDKLKKRAQKACESRGVRFLGGYAIPYNKAKLVADELEAIAVEYEQARAHLVANYDRFIQEWQNAPNNKEWAHIIKDEAPGKAYVESALGFKWQACKVRSVDDSEEAAEQLSRGLKQAEQGLAGTLFREIAQEAAAFEERTLCFGDANKGRHAREYVSQRCKNALEAIREKMEGLAFLDPCVRPIIETIDYSINLLPSKGKIEGIHLTTLWGLTGILKRPDRMRAFGQQCLDSGDVAATFGFAVGANESAVDDETELAPVQVPQAPVQHSVAVGGSAVTPVRSARQLPSLPLPLPLPTQPGTVISLGI
ncbi:DUF3150 domain-containing protein [Ralstonia pickettii]|uniref:DUF3150 domain-containing protein n=1 Tax=Ralstonia pickettii TaxID=329 RepID=A0AAW4Q635_RALPI|nr:DUF3150 domain-containing protein [Ralstonia pickettii]MBA9846700.1 DUF3150 domain-containing protein [Ralstonia pickettii]MBA9852148.1 DUF3150 domain-containing protein [Ralstonia pickettii]MBA9919838.1 DUF3150 domain-containing protein [Ralstonia pickettii]MBA9958940.1 DUF3150 domain-containing protein [Ralstonia pickettii]MBA9964682.1 DUF3150 domain-containing protein [Ralstonia pickettii]